MKEAIEKIFQELNDLKAASQKEVEESMLDKSDSGIEN